MEPKKIHKTKEEMRLHFSQVNLSAEKRESLQSLLLNQGLETHQKSSVTSVGFFQKLRNTKLVHVWGYGAAVLATALASFALTNSWVKESEAVADFASIPPLRSYPPDFDLEGDASAFSEIVQEVFPTGEGFAGEIPAEVKGQYSPSEGRFFTWAGGPAVSIRMHNKSKGLTKNPQTTLYIVRLSGKADRNFPSDSVTRRFEQSGKERKVKLWREGNYGYAFVQSAIPE